MAASPHGDTLTGGNIKHHISGRNHVGGFNRRVAHLLSHHKSV
jgi:hypothetical protein